MVLFCSSGANRDTHAPNDAYAWSNAVTPTLARSAVQSLLAELWSLVLASAAVGAIAASTAMRMNLFTVTSSLISSFHEGRSPSPAGPVRCSVKIP